MNITEIKKAINNIHFNEVRFDNDVKFEAVLIKSELAVLTVQLASFFGSPLFPSKTKLSKEISQEIEVFGGIMAGQTLYFLSRDGDTIFAMLWPWQDNQHITLKIIKRLNTDK
ncbi:MAG: hypothetical protein PHQ96_03930 [Candidatus Omnitrophica bacterium]|nr:hypothetical protein [Candidatus Omnitrophota bacterium]